MYDTIYGAGQLSILTIIDTIYGAGQLSILTIIVDFLQQFATRIAHVSNSIQYFKI